MRFKNESAFGNDQQRLWEKMNEEKEREKRKNEGKLRELDEERHRLEIALEREREERERHEVIERQKKIENEIINKNRF